MKYLIFFAFLILFSVSSYLLGFTIGSFHAAKKYQPVSEMSYNISCINQMGEESAFLINKCANDAVEFGKLINYFQIDILDDKDYFIIEDQIYKFYIAPTKEESL